MTEIRLDLAADIKRHHELACSKTEERVKHAIGAGKLLLEAKAALQHGEWLGSLESNVFVKARQAQGYMQIDQGRPLPFRAGGAA